MPSSLYGSPKTKKNVLAGVVFERHTNLHGLGLTLKSKLQTELDLLLKSCWGAFPSDFIDHHIFTADAMIVARIKHDCVGVCIMSVKKILGLKIHYIEFLLVDKPYQKSGLGSLLFYLVIRGEVLRNMVSMFIGKPLEVFFITPNIKVLSRMAKFASFMYPNPYLADKESLIPPADEQTWLIANEIIRQSDNPSRRLDRRGLVLHDSYVNTPWLVYNNDTAPWHSSEQLNAFAKRYLGYHNAEDKEFLVRAHINLFSLLRYLFHP